MRKWIAALGCLTMTLAGCGKGVSGHTYACDTGRSLKVQFEFKSSGKLLETRTLSGASIHREYDYKEDGDNVTYGEGFRATLVGDDLVIPTSPKALYCHKQ